MQVSHEQLTRTIAVQHGPTLDPYHAAQIVTDNYIVLDRAHPDKPEFDLYFNETTGYVESHQQSHRVYIDNLSIEEYEREARMYIYMHQKALELRAAHNDKEVTKLARILHTTSEVSFEDCMEQAKELIDMGVKFKLYEIPATPEI